MSNASMEPGAKGGVKDRCPLNSQVDRAGHIESLKHSHNERQRDRGEAGGKVYFEILILRACKEICDSLLRSTCEAERTWM